MNMSAEPNTANHTEITFGQPRTGKTTAYPGFTNVRWPTASIEQIMSAVELVHDRATERYKQAANADAQQNTKH